MAGDAPSRGSGVSFSEMTELPPLKEVYIAPPPPPPALQQEPSLTPNFHAGSEPEKPKVQPREVAEKAIKEIKNVPPSLMVYSIAGAAVLILIIAIALVLHINHLNSDDDSLVQPAEPANQAAASQPAAPSQPAQVQVPQPSSVPAQTQPAESVEESQPAPTHVAAAAARGRNSRKKSAAPIAPVVVPGQMAIDSTPQGAQVQLDGKTDPSWVTPFTLSGLNPGQHTRYRQQARVLYRHSYRRCCFRQQVICRDPSRAAYGDAFRYQHARRRQRLYRWQRYRQAHSRASLRG